MKKFICFILAAIMISGMSLNCLALNYGDDIDPNTKSYQQTFHDVPTSHWAFQYISELAERGAINGFADGRYYPNNTVTRAQFSKIMVVAAGLTPQTGINTGFADVPLSHWSSPFVAVAKPYMTAYTQTNGTYVFKPDTPALREDIAVAVVMLKGYDTSIADLGMLQTMFTDYTSISAAIRPYIAVAVEKGIISGYGDRTFRGQNTITRAEAAAILWRAFQFGNDNKVSAGDVPESTNNNVQAKPEVTPAPSEDIIDEPEEIPEESEEIPEEPEIELKHRVETVASLPRNVDDMVFTKTGDIYYLKDNKLFEISDGKETQLFDGNSDYYEETTVGEMATLLSEDPQKRYTSITDASHDWVNYCNDTDVIYFDEFTLLELEYDQKNNRVYIYGYCCDETYYRGWKFYYDKIFDVREMTDPIYCIARAEASGYTERDTSTICSNDALFFSIYSFYGVELTLKINATTGTALEYTMVDIYSDYLFVANELIKIEKEGWNNSVKKYSLSNNSWENINLADTNINGATALCTYEDKIFFSTESGIYFFENAGTNRLKSTEFLTFDELLISDDVPMVSPSTMLFDDNGDILFVDEDHHLLRKIILE